MTHGPYDVVRHYWWPMTHGSLSCLGFVGLHHPQISTTLVVHQSPPSLNCSYTSHIVAHIPRFRIVARFPCIVALLALPAFPNRPITSRISCTSLSLLVPGAWFLICLGGSPGQITCCSLNCHVLNPPLHVIPFPLFLSIPPVPPIYI